MDFRVDLNIFNGPLDLLLYLVRKHEVDIIDIPIAAIADQYMLYLETLKELDVNAVGDFLALASLLIEIKSQQALPRNEEETVEEIEDPRQELVERLLEYKKFRDAASVLEEQGRQWQQRYPRLATDLPRRGRDLAEEPIREVELWDLVSAFGRMMRARELVKPSNIVYDETPIHVYMERIYKQLQEQGRLAFESLFAPGMHKSQLVGMFLAILELVRHYRVLVEQNDLFGEIWVVANPEGAVPLNFSTADEYGAAEKAAS